MSHLNENCDPMSYVLLYPFGEPGYRTNIPHTRPAEKGTQIGNVSEKEFYMYRIAYRDQSRNHIHACGKLFQQYLVDSYVKIEQSRLNYLRNNQDKIRVQNYSGLMDHLARVREEEDLLPGRIFVLPSTFTGSERNMRQHYQDAMSLVAKFGKPDLFITFTANPKWPEITSNLLPNQPYTDRPDICCRVFDVKLKEFLDDLTKKHVLGRVQAYCAVVEFQKRGLPHAHILLFLHPNDKIDTAQHLDEIIWAEFPDQEKHPELFELVKKHMIHRCDERCLENRQCRKGYPKRYCAESHIIENGFPLYKRRYTDGIEIPRNGRIEVIRNDRIVPYNPFLLLKYNCHINVELSASPHNVIYLFNYIFKGHDLAKARVENVGDNNRLDYDEINHFVDGRFLTAFEACYRIFGFDLIYKSHVIERLDIHLPDEHTLVFPENPNLRDLYRATIRKSKLLEWFELNKRDENARQYLYSEIPQHYRFHESNRRWIPRVRDATEKVLGRLYSISPARGELFYLRLLLLEKRGRSY